MSLSTTDQKKNHPELRALPKTLIIPAIYTCYNMRRPKSIRLKVFSGVVLFYQGRGVEHRLAPQFFLNS